MFALGGVLVSKTVLAAAGALIVLGAGAWIAVHSHSLAAEPGGEAPTLSLAHTDELARVEQAPSQRETASQVVSVPSPEDAVKYWLARFNEAPEDGQHGMRVASEIAKLAPDEALRIMTAVWPNLSVAVKEQAIRPFVLDHGHVHALKILHLAATDAAMSVQGRAFGFLISYALQDFAADYDGYLRWAARYDEMPLKDAVIANAQSFVTELLALSPEDLRKKAKSLQDLRLDVSSDVKVTGIDVAAVLRDGGGLKVVEAWLEDDDPKTQRMALQWSKWLHADEAWLRSWVLPAIDRPENVDSERLSSSFVALGRPDCAWARESILAYLTHSTETERPATALAAMALADIGDPATIPSLIEILIHDHTGKLAYDVGYGGLAKLTGVRWQKSYDGAWWLDWWEKNRMRLPPGVRDATIRR
jgi:hypothetical protein